MKPSRHGWRSRLRGAFPVIVIAGPLAAQMTWTAVSDQRGYHSLASDLQRGRVVQFGGRSDDTHEWDGTRWTVMRPAHRPPARAWAAMVHDLGRARTVLYGGIRQTSWGMVDTWEWDGTDWRRAIPATEPIGRFGHAMAYDAGRGRTVLFGGLTDMGGPPTQETWEWDGTNWTRKNPVNAPPARAFHAMAYDLPNGRTLLFGGSTSTYRGQQFNDTWAWDGTNWTQLSPLSSPSARYATMAADLTTFRIVLYGGTSGMDAPGMFSDTWEWDGANWIAMNASAPGPRAGHAMAYDPTGRRMLLSRGVDAQSQVQSDLWSWDGSAWSQLVAATDPAARYDHAMAYDSVRARTVLFGGFDDRNGPRSDTWEWDGSRWEARTPAASPTARSAHLLAFDARRRRTVLFGGSGLNDTWEWDGVNWQQLVPAAPPPPQVRAAMVWDDARQRVFLYGSDNYEWDGSQWTHRPSAVRPVSTSGHAMVFDPRRGRVVLFGGQGPTSELLEWDGTNWTRLVPPTAPPTRRTATMVFAPRLARTIMLGEYDTTTPWQNDVWDWDGTAWTNRTPYEPFVPSGRLGCAMVWDAARECAVVFGGRVRSPGGDTWELAPAHPARYEAYGSGCPGRAGTPVLANAPWQLPWLGDAFTAEVRGLPPSAAGLLLTGVSRGSWLGLPLPFDLTASGMPGCSLRASGQLVLPLQVNGTIGSLGLAIPSDATLVDRSFYQQAVVADPGANAAGLIVSNGGEGRVGRR